MIVSQPSFSQQNREEELKKIVETGKENEEVVDALNELALLNQPTNHNKSLEYAEDAAKIARKIFYPKGIALAQSIAGDLYADKFDRHDKAIECYIEAFSNYKLLYKQGLLSQEEMNHFILDDFMHSYQLIISKEATTRKEKKALKQYKDLQAEVAPYLVTIASAAITKSKEGEKEIEKVKTIAAEKEKELKEKEKELKEKQETLQQQHWELRKKQKQAQELAKIKSILSDSLFNTSIFLNMTADSLKYVLEQLVEQRTKAQTEKMQQVLDDIERRSQIEAIEHEKQRQQKNTTILLIILGMSSAICAVYYIGYRRQKKLRKILEEQNEYIKKQNEEIIAQRDNIAQQKSEIERQRDKIREKNEQITASINYAERIQRSILPDDEEIQSALPDSFVLFKPRDVVSGDFYWFDNTNKEGKIIISAIDCTGHGVPGALMSMIGNTLMNEIVHHKKILSPELILNELNKEVCKALRQNETGGRDGMDMTICVIDKKNKILEFAGANNPLIYIQDRQIHRIKGDAMPVGGVHFNKKAPEGFTKHVVDCSKETCFYIFSDGFQDQFGGPKDMKFMAKRMAKLILNIHDQPMFIQKEILYEALVDWMGGEGEHAKYRQVDDILVIGVRLKFN
ncbi:MAG: SpoIIE family protein phosphatase [Flammeovirgaceae bacterium]|nr:SpoIIE family protein phosphatase [Flammeovirgaceae bacterium]MDW8286667.1 SpoIIE family protein phosphatase [Flammeovirgaceae bacterium]